MRLLHAALGASLMLHGCQKGSESQDSSAVIEHRQKPALPAERAKGGTSIQALPIALDQFLVFSKPQECEVAEENIAFWDGILKYGNGTGGRLGTLNVPDAYRPAFGLLSFRREDDYGIAHLAVSGTWHGLHLLEIENGINRTDAWFHIFVFKEDFEKVRTTLNGIGFSINAKGEQETPPFYEGARVNLDPYGKGSMLTCWF
jgi:hypothetical protein